MKFSEEKCPKCEHFLLNYCEVTRFPPETTHLYCIECHTLYSLRDGKLLALVPTVVQYADLESMIKCWRSKK